MQLSESTDFRAKYTRVMKKKILCQLLHPLLSKMTDTSLQPNSEEALNLGVIIAKLSIIRSYLWGALRYSTFLFLEVIISH